MQLTNILKGLEQCEQCHDQLLILSIVSYMTLVTLPKGHVSKVITSEHVNRLYAKPPFYFTVGKLIYQTRCAALFF